MTLTIDPEFKQLIPPLTADERAALEASLIAEGCRDPLVTWDGVIIDGHNRYAICTAHGIPFQTVEREFEDRTAAKLWIIGNQLARRNLTPYARGVLVLRQKEHEAAKAKARQVAVLKQGEDSPVDPMLDQRETGRTLAKLAAAANVSHGTLHKVEKVEDTAPEAVKTAARAGDISTNRAYELTRELGKLPAADRDTAARLCGDSVQKAQTLARLYKSMGSPTTNGTYEEIIRTGGFHYGDDMDRWLDFAMASMEQIDAALKSIAKHHAREAIIARREQAQTEHMTQHPGPGISGVILGDMREIGEQISDNSIDVVFTDPPYPGDFLPLFSDLSALAARVLKPGGVCMVYSGQIHLPKVIARLSEHLDYVWMCAIRHSGGNQRIFKANVNTGWKPVLMYAKPPFKPYWDSFIDITSGGREKEFDEWQQAEAEAAYFLRALCLPGGTVLDPFAGGGTTLAAAHKLGLQYIGIENDPDDVEKIRQRLQGDTATV